MLFARRRQTTIVNLLICTLFIFSSYYLYTSINKNDNSINLIIELKPPNDDVYQIFYEIGDGFNERDSEKLAINKNNRYQVLRFSLPSNIKSIRLDTGSAPETVFIKKITWENGLRKVEWNTDKIVQRYSSSKNIEGIVKENNNVKIICNGKDPYMVFNNLEDINKYLNNTSLEKVISFIILLLLTIIIFLSLQITNCYFAFISKVGLQDINSIVLCCAVITILVLPSISTHIGIVSNTTNVEKRNMAEKPILNLKEQPFGKFAKEYEEYVNDNFGFRDKLIAWNNILKVKYLKVSPIDRVIVGKEGWLFYNDEGVVDDYRGINHFSSVELETIKRNLEERKQWLEDQGINFYITVAPNKHTIYPEYLPSNIKKYNEISRLDQLIRYLKANSCVEIIDLRQTIKSNKGIDNLYKKSDTHWNDLGAFCAYTQIINVIKEDNPNIRPLSLDDYSVEYFNSGGDLANMLSMNELLLEKCPALVPKFNSSVRNVKVDKTLYPNPNRLVVTENEFSPKSYKILMFRDSFTTSLIPFLSENFNRSVYIWDHNFNTDMIKYEKPDIVIHELVERKLDQLLYKNPEEIRK